MQPPGNITPIDSRFNYAELPEPDASYLKEQAAYIHARRAITENLIIEMGHALIEAKGRLPGVFLVWARAEFGFSDDTLENYMKVARNMGNNGAVHMGMYHARALYKLASDSTPDAARVQAGEIAATGQKVTYDTARILADAPEPVKRRFLDGAITEKDAAGLTTIYKRSDIPARVKTDCLEAGVTDAAVVEYLAGAYLDGLKTVGTKNPRTTYADIKADGWTLNGLGWSVKLAEARQLDIERFKVDRQQMHIDAQANNYEWIRCGGTLVLGQDGSPVVYLDGIGIPADSDGQPVMIDMRISRADAKRMRRVS